MQFFMFQIWLERDRNIYDVQTLSIFIKCEHFNKHKPFDEELKLKNKKNYEKRQIFIYGNHKKQKYCKPIIKNFPTT